MARRKVESYESFLAAKVPAATAHGKSVADGDVHQMLHPWQRRIVRWAVGQGRAAIWADTGLGKTFIMLEAAKLAGDRALIVGPLAVCHQTVREAAKLGMTARYVRGEEEADGPGIWVTNYEMAAKFDASKLDTVILDEASILKQSDGKTRTMLIKHFQNVPYRMTATATPMPNDIEELTSQAEFLGVMPRAEMLAAYFIHDTDGWRIKGHAKAAMFRWMATWAVALRRPSDIGGDDTGYILPGYDVITHAIPVDVMPDGQLFATSLGGVSGRASIRKETMQARCEETARVVAAEPNEQWVIWCDLNDEAKLLSSMITGAVNIHGSLTPEEKADGLLRFADGQIRVLVTKPKIASFGMNWQGCARMAFCGMGDSMEKYYQAIRRCYRYGQSRRVHVHVVLSELEVRIAENVARKERRAAEMSDALVREMRTAGELGKV
jgi:superfamily II DNA or RNA helicase